MMPRFNKLLKDCLKKTCYSLEMKELSFRIIIDAQLDGKLAERALSYKNEFFIALS